jgi:hypothetical protein
VGTNSNVRKGTNVVAVELHQTSVFSSDTVFGMSLTTILPTPLRITNQPQSQVVSEGKPVTFTVGVEGPDPAYQWYQQLPAAGTPTKVGSNGPTYVIAYPRTSQSGLGVSLVCSNVLGAVTSDVAVLTVLKDVFPPGLISAIASDNLSNKVTVTFTEPLLSAAFLPGRGTTNVTNYIIRRLGTTNTVIVTNASHVGDTVTLTVGGPGWIWDQDYVLTVGHVADFRTNYMSPLSNQVAIAFPKLLVGWNGTSLGWDAVGASQQSPPIELATNWLQADFDDSGPLWMSVVGIAFAAPNTPVTLCANRGDTLDYASGAPRYFRTHFTAPANTGKGWIRLRYVIDDGAVFYLNGQETYRVNLPSGRIYPRTFALSSVTPNCAETNLALQGLRTGDNVLAVEVHNSSSPQDLDLYYGVELSATLLPDPIVIPPPRLAIVPAEGDRVRLDWPVDTGLDWMLEATTDITSGPWVPVATSPPFQTNVSPGLMQFFRLRVAESH